MSSSRTLALLLVAALAGATGCKKPQAQGRTLKVGVNPVPHGEILREAATTLWL